MKSGTWYSFIFNFEFDFKATSGGYSWFHAQELLREASGSRD